MKPNPTTEGEFSFPSTGDAERDEDIARQFVLHSERMQMNVCPNGCGQMTWIDAHNRECTGCGFQGFSTKPFDMEAGQA